MERPLLPRWSEASERGEMSTSSHRLRATMAADWEWDLPPPEAVNNEEAEQQSAVDRSAHALGWLNYYAGLDWRQPLPMSRVFYNLGEPSVFSCRHSSLSTQPRDAQLRSDTHFGSSHCTHGIASPHSPHPWLTTDSTPAPALPACCTRGRRLCGCRARTAPPPRARGRQRPLPPSLPPAAGRLASLARAVRVRRRDANQRRAGALGR